MIGKILYEKGGGIEPTLRPSRADYTKGQSINIVYNYNNYRNSYAGVSGDIRTEMAGKRFNNRNQIYFNYLIFP